MNSPHQFLYKIQPTRLAMQTEGPTAEEDRLVGEHLQYLKGLMDAGVVKLTGRTLNDGASTFGIVIFKPPIQMPPAPLPRTTRQSDSALCALRPIRFAWH